MKCNKCGQLIEDESRFCGNCGTPVESPPPAASFQKDEKQVAPPVENKQVASSEKNKAAAPPRKDPKRPPWGLIAVAGVGALLLVAAGVLALLYLTSAQKTDKSASGTALPSTDDASVTLSSKDNASATLSPYDDKDVAVQVKKVNDLSLAKEIDAAANLVEVKRSDGQKSLDFYSTIRIPYDADKMDAGQKASDCVVAAYYNPDTKTWDPVLYELDTQNKVAVISTDHFSLFGVFTFKNKGKRSGSVSLPRSIVWSDLPKVKDYPKVLNDMTLGIDTSALEAGQAVLNDAVNFGGAAMTVSTEPFRIMEPLSKWPRVDKIGNCLTVVGVALAGIQVIQDYQEEGKVGPKTLVNAIKGAGFSAISHFGSSALKLKAVGYFLIDYSITSFGTEAWSNLESKYRKIYLAYYRRRYGGDMGEQRHLLLKVHDAYRQSLAQGRRFNLQEEVTNTLTTHCNEFWGQSTLEHVDKMKQASDAWFSNLLPSKQKTISDGYCGMLMSTIGVSIRTTMIQRIVMDLTKEYMTNMEKIRRELNKKVVVTIAEPRGGDESPYQYVGHLVRFAPLNKEAVVTSWQGHLPKDGDVRVPFRIAGYLSAGSPNRIQVFKPDDNPETDKPVLEVPFVLDRDKISVTLSPGVAMYAGTYETVVPAKKMILAEIARQGSIGESATDANVRIVVDKEGKMKVEYNYSYAYRMSDTDKEPFTHDEETELQLQVNEDGTFLKKGKKDNFKGKFHIKNGKMVVDVEMVESLWWGFRKTIKFSATRK